jgi:outer membrane receptor protein involved in Fe transport
MINKLLLLTLLLLSSVIYSQGQQDKLHSYKITGTVLDSITNEPLTGITIVLLDKSSGKIIKGTTTNDKGEFDLFYTKAANIRLKLSGIGYKDLYSDALKFISGKCSLGNIYLTQAIMQTDAIVIKGEKQMIDYLIDKEVINVDQVPKGNGTVADALQNSGLVDVDQTNKTISLKGSTGVKILVNGKPEPNIDKTLFQMPSSYVEKIEIMTTPSSKYEAEGDVGIINLITAKNMEDNFNGSLSLYTNTKGQNYPSAYLNYRKDKFNLFTSAWGGLQQSVYSNTSYLNKYNVIIPTHEATIGNSNSNYKNGSFALGIDYDPDTLNSFSVSGSYVESDNDNNMLSNSDISDLNNNLPIYNYSFGNNSKNIYNSQMYQGFYKRKFNNNGCEFTTDIYWSKLTTGNNNENTTDYSNLVNPVLQNNSNNARNNTYNINSDYVNPTENFGKFETGYKFTYRDRRNDYTNEDFVYSVAKWYDSSGVSNDFRYKESILAFYGTWTYKIWIFDLKAGMRIERTYANGIQYTTGESFSNTYTDFFPTINLSHNISPSLRLYLNATRRITRPQMELINPFTIINSPNSVSQGNPLLKPTYSNIFETGLNPFIKLYYTLNTGNPTGINTVLPDGRFYNTTVNMTVRHTYGADLTIQLMKGSPLPVTVPDWLGMANVTLSYMKLTQTADLSIETVNENININRDTWSLRTNENFNLWEKFKLRLFYVAAFKYKDSRYTKYTMSWMSISLSRDFFDDKLSVSVSGNNLFTPTGFKTEVIGSDFYSSNEMNMSWNRNVSLSLSWNFNDYKFHQTRNVDDGRDKPSDGN